MFWGQAVDSTLLCTILSQATKPIEDTMEQMLQLLDYIATQEESVLTYSASDMKLAVHSDASYLSEPQACIRAGGHFFLLVVLVIIVLIRLAISITGLDDVLDVRHALLQLIESLYCQIARPHPTNDQRGCVCDRRVRTEFEPPHSYHEQGMHAVR